MIQMRLLSLFLTVLPVMARPSSILGPEIKPSSEFARAADPEFWQRKFEPFRKALPLDDMSPVGIEGPKTGKVQFMGQTLFKSWEGRALVMRYSDGKLAARWTNELSEGWAPNGQKIFSGFLAERRIKLWTTEGRVLGELNFHESFSDEDEQSAPSELAPFKVEEFSTGSCHGTSAPPRNVLRKLDPEQFVEGERLSFAALAQSGPVWYLWTADKQNGLVALIPVLRTGPTGDGATWIKMAFSGVEGEAQTACIVRNGELDGSFRYLGEAELSASFKAGRLEGPVVRQEEEVENGGGGYCQSFSMHSYQNGKREGQWLELTPHCACDSWPDGPANGDRYVEQSFYREGKLRSQLSAWNLKEGDKIRWRLRERRQATGDPAHMKVLRAERNELSWGLIGEHGQVGVWYGRRLLGSPWGWRRDKSVKVYRGTVDPGYATCDAGDCMEGLKWEWVEERIPDQPCEGENCRQAGLGAWSGAGHPLGGANMTWAGTVTHQGTPYFKFRADGTGRAAERLPAAGDWVVLPADKNAKANGLPGAAPRTPLDSEYSLPEAGNERLILSERFQLPEEIWPHAVGEGLEMPDHLWQAGGKFFYYCAQAFKTYRLSEDGILEAWRWDFFDGKSADERPLGERVSVGPLRTTRGDRWLLARSGVSTDGRLLLAVAKAAQSDVSLNRDDLVDAFYPLMPLKSGRYYAWLGMSGEREFEDLVPPFKSEDGKQLFIVITDAAAVPAVFEVTVAP